MNDVVVEAQNLQRVYSVRRGLFRAPAHLQAVGDISFKLEKEPVTGSGSFRSTVVTHSETNVCMRVQVIGSGAMAPMWEAVSKPLLPTLAKSFAASLKAEIEQIPVIKTSLLAALMRRLQQVFAAVFGKGSTSSRDG